MHCAGTPLQILGGGLMQKNPVSDLPQGLPLAQLRQYWPMCSRLHVWLSKPSQHAGLTKAFTITCTYVWVAQAVHASGFYNEYENSVIPGFTTWGHDNC